MNGSTYNGAWCLKNRVFTETEETTGISWTLVTPGGRVWRSASVFSRSRVSSPKSTPHVYSDQIL